jgi:putative transcriptional regulator
MENKIRYFRFMNNEMTQADLAEKVGVTRQTIIAIEKGAFNPSVKLALKMAKLFRVKVDEIFALEEKDEREKP